MSKSKKEEVLEKQLAEAKIEIDSLKKKIEYKGIKKHTNSSYNLDYIEYYDIDIHKKETLLTWMNYKVFKLPNCEKNIFHDTLKGFEEFSKLKGYILFLSIDTSLNNKIAFKFDSPDGLSKWSNSWIYKSLDEYLLRVKENKGVDDINANCSNKLQEFQLKSNLKNRMLLIQHSYKALKEVIDFTVKGKDKEIALSYDKIQNLQNQMKELEEDKHSSDEDKTLLELKINSLKYEKSCLENECFRQDSVIDHLRSVLIESLSSKTQTINVGGDLDMSKKIENIKADKSNLMLDSNNSSQSITISSNIQGLLDSIKKLSGSDDNLSKSEYIQVIDSIEDIRKELATEQPNKQLITERISLLGSFSSIASLVGQLTPMIANLI